MIKQFIIASFGKVQLIVPQGHKCFAVILRMANAVFFRKSLVNAENCKGR